MSTLARQLLLAGFALWAAVAAAGAEGPTHNIVNLSAEASREVANDLAVAVLTAAAEGSEPKRPADEVNQAVNWALEQARAADGIKVETQGYSSSPIYRDNTLRGWRVQQSIRLESGDPAALSQLVGRLQERLALQSLTFAVSTQAQRAAEGELIARALEAFRQRADLIRRELGRSSYRLVNLDVNTAGAPPPQPILRGNMALAAGAVHAPSFEAGTRELTVRVSGSVELTED